MNKLSCVCARMPPSVELGLPAYFYEAMTINVKPMKNNYIMATSLYEDSGAGSVTSIDNNVFGVTTALGMFEGAKTVTVNYNNLEKTREVVISFK